MTTLVLSISNGSYSILEAKKINFKNLDEFEFRQDLSIIFEVSTP